MCCQGFHVGEKEHVTLSASSDQVAVVQERFVFQTATEGGLVISVFAAGPQTDNCTTCVRSRQLLFARNKPKQ